MSEPALRADTGCGRERGGGAGAMKVKRSSGAGAAAPACTEDELLRKALIGPEDVLGLQKVTTGERGMLRGARRPRGGPGPGRGAGRRLPAGARLCSAAGQGAARPSRSRGAAEQASCPGPGLRPGPREPPVGRPRGQGRRARRPGSCAGGLPRAPAAGRAGEGRVAAPRVQGLAWAVTRRWQQALN